MVLIVDDDSWIRTIMADLLAGEGFNVVQTGDGNSGLALVEEQHPNVILLDLAMPGEPGLEVLRTLKSRRDTREIPVIVVSAYAVLLRFEDLRRADRVLGKPFDFADLLTCVRQAARIPAQR
jgi:CheY-like chemotaxis protein